MPALVSFDLVLLGLKDPGPAGRSRFASIMARLTEGDPLDFQDPSRLKGQPLFEAVSAERAREITGLLQNAGVQVEIRPVPGRPPTGDRNVVATRKCPRCGFVQPASEPECQGCGLIFAKWEREQIQKMQRDRKLEETLTKLVQVREEWRAKAKRYLEKHPLPAGATTQFEKRLHPEEIPFLRLTSANGPILMTSRRMLVTREGTVLSIPYEIIADVDVGGGLTLKKDQINMVLKFAGPFPVGGEGLKSLKLLITKESAHYRDVVMDWAFARSFPCGSCGATDMDFRLERGKLHARCMHCATDHEIDLEEAVAIPRLAD